MAGKPNLDLSRPIRLTDKVKPAVVECISQSGDDTEVIIRPCNWNRSGAQNALYWKHMSEFEKHASEEWSGRTKDEWHRHFKFKHLVNIIEESDDEAAMTIREARRVYNKCTEQGKLAVQEMLSSFISTSTLTTKQMAEYMRQIDLDQKMYLLIDSKFTGLTRPDTRGLGDNYWSKL